MMRPPLTLGGRIDGADAQNKRRKQCMYDDDFYFFDPIPSEKELEMNDAGFDHITNFTPDRECYYRKASEIHGIKYAILDEAYSFQGNRVPGLKAFYVDSTVGDLSEFWRTVEILKDSESTELNEVEAEQ